MPSFKRILFYPDVLRRLGLSNVAYIAWYRFSLKSGIRKWFFKRRPFLIDADFYRPSAIRDDYPGQWKDPLLLDADKISQGQLRYYAHHWKNLGNPPNWFLNPFNNKLYPRPCHHWTGLSDFNADVGDIKNVWEASRFEWLATLARAYSICGNAVYLDVLNQWLKNWAEMNPLNIGPNWKCGQEASIRVFNLVNAALFMNQVDKPNPILAAFVYQHLERINANIRYAIAQNNNHGFSEAAALFIGGLWISRTHSFPRLKERCTYFARRGRKWLENLTEKLIEKDGSFSQHSVTYHRVLLDTLIFSDYWRRRLRDDDFSGTFYDRARAALNWLILLTDEISNNAPNVGANDGTLLLNNHACDYRDLRPSVQTASILFNGKKYYDNGLWDEPCYWFDLRYKNAEKSDRERISTVLPGGYVIMIGKDSWGMIRFPMFRFRPSHNDVFHFDLWFRGENICRDAGSYSYNSGREVDNEYFRSVKAHNTVSFDNSEQMPQLGRFMLGRWIRADHIGIVDRSKNDGNVWTGAYTDCRGNRHQRDVSWRENTWVIQDRFSGSYERAEVMFRLIPASYNLRGNKVTAPWGFMEITASDFQIKMSTGFESNYYWEKKRIDSLAIIVGRNSQKITTRIVFE